MRNGREDLSRATFRVDDDDLPDAFRRDVFVQLRQVDHSHPVDIHRVASLQTQHQTISSVRARLSETERMRTLAIYKRIIDFANMSARHKRTKWR